MENFVERLKIFRKDEEIISVEYWLGNKELLFTIECFLKDGQWYAKQSEYGAIGARIEYNDLIKRLNNYVRKEKLEKLLS